eukprot:13940693-Alexandrium_andersonii.AAC.1
MRASPRPSVHTIAKAALVLSPPRASTGLVGLTCSSPSICDLSCLRHLANSSSRGPPGHSRAFEEVARDTARPQPNLTQGSFRPEDGA